MKRLLWMALPIVALAQGPVKEYRGVITDTMCGANHAHMGVQPGEKCVRECVKSGKWKYALVDSRGKRMVLSDQQTPDQYAAKRVKIRGVFYEKTGRFRVDSLLAAD